MHKTHKSPCGCRCSKCLLVWWTCLEADPEDGCCTYDAMKVKCPNCDSDVVSVVNGCLDIKEAVKHYASMERERNH